MTTKIVDNTFISACIDEIACIDLLDVSSKFYELITSKEVQKETKKGFDPKTVFTAYSSIEVHSLSDSIKYNELKNWLQNRYPGLHDGEISTFLLALLLFEVEDNSKYYYVTDDGYMKNIINKLNTDEKFLEILGIPVDMDHFNVTGTVGFTRRLIDKKIISQSYIEPILKDMEDNGFYLNEKVKNHLRGI